MREIKTQFHKVEVPVEAPKVLSELEEVELLYSLMQKYKFYQISQIEVRLARLRS